MADFTNIRTELQQFFPTIRADFIKKIERDFVDCADMFDTHAANICYDRRYARYCVVRGYTSYDRYAENPVRTLNVPRIEKHADEYAQAQIDAFVLKLERKLSDLDEVNVDSINLHGFEFVLSGKRGDDNVTVEQRVVFKCSSKGTPFVQWPARIYVNNKFTSEKAFKEMVAA